MLMLFSYENKKNPHKFSSPRLRRIKASNDDDDDGNFSEFHKVAVLSTVSRSNWDWKMLVFVGYNTTEYGRIYVIQHVKLSNNAEILRQNMILFLIIRMTFFTKDGCRHQLVVCRWTLSTAIVESYCFSAAFKWFHAQTKNLKPTQTAS